MQHLIIRFPFSSVNDEQYMLALCLHYPVAPQFAIDALNADSEVFTPGVSQTDGDDTIYNYTGTLQGSVQVTDDDREDFFEPVVATKLSFSMACQTFPEWLMQFCDLRWASVILYKDNDTNVELWRGYLMAQSLNMTVVNNLMACSMVAIDEIGMAKYMPLNKNINAGYHCLTISTIMTYFNNLHFTYGFTVNGINGVGFERYYLLLGLQPVDKFLWRRNMALADDYGAEVAGLPFELVVNLDKWLNDDKATWHDLFDAMFRYLGVTLCMGSWAGETANDAYLMTCPVDDTAIATYVYDFTQGPQQASINVLTLINPTKIGGDLQITVDPGRYKSVKVESEPHRWDRHEYLTNDHYKEIAKDKEVKYLWGEMDSAAGPFSQGYGWHKLKYTKPDADEAEFVELAPCQNGEGYVMASSGELPYVDLTSCDGKTEPDYDVADTLDFITFKEGCCTIKMGQGEIDGIDEDAELNHYFLIMNHNWGNMFRHKDHEMQKLHLGDTPWLTLWPMGNDEPMHPSCSHYLTAKIQVKFIRENMPSVVSGSSDKRLYLKAVNAQTPNVMVFWDTTPAIIMPSESSLHDFADTNYPFCASVGLWYDLYFQAYIKCGEFYYNGTSWVHVNGGDTPPKCDVTLWNDTNEITSVLNVGQRMIATKNYYYTISNPYRGSNTVDRYTNQTRLLTDMIGSSIHNQPLQGKLEIQVLGQIRLQGGSFDVQNNSIPFVLIDGIDIGYTDEAEMIGDDIANKAEVTIDANSQTKEVMERKLEMATPSVDGFFDNVMLFDGGKLWHNLTAVTRQGGLVPTTPERMLAGQLAGQYSTNQCFVELSTPIHYDDNLHNMDFRVMGLTETDGRFLPLKRTFDYRLERMRVKLQRVNIPLSE